MYASVWNRRQRQLLYEQFMYFWEKHFMCLAVPRRPAAVVELIRCYAPGPQVIMPHNLYLHSALVQSRCAPSGCVCTGIAPELLSIS